MSSIWQRITKPHGGFFTLKEKIFYCQFWGCVCKMPIDDRGSSCIRFWDRACVCVFCLFTSQCCLTFVSADQELMACLYCLTNMLQINIPYKCYNTRENPFLSAGRQTSNWNQAAFWERAAAPSGHLHSVDCMFLCWLQSTLLTVVTMESKCFLSPACSLINPEKVSVLAFTHTVCPRASAFLSVLAQCTVVSHWRRLQMSPGTRSLAPSPPSSSQRTTDSVAFDFGIRLKKPWAERGVGVY